MENTIQQWWDSLHIDEKLSIAYKNVKQLFSSEHPLPINETVEEAAKNHKFTIISVSGYSNYNLNPQQQAFIQGAAWQKQQDEALRQSHKELVEALEEKLKGLREEFFKTKEFLKDDIGQLDTKNDPLQFMSFNRGKQIGYGDSIQRIEKALTKAKNIQL